MDAVLALKNSITANRVGARPRAPPPHPGPPRPPPPAVLGPDPSLGPGRRSVPACRWACPAPSPPDVGRVTLSLSLGTRGRPPRICCPQVCAGTSQAPESRGKKAPRPRPRAASPAGGAMTGSRGARLRAALCCGRGGLPGGSDIPLGPEHAQLGQGSAEGKREQHLLRLRGQSAVQVARKHGRGRGEQSVTQRFADSRLGRPEGLEGEGRRWGAG